MKRCYSVPQNVITEAQNPETARIDTLPTGSILRLINREDLKVAACVRRAIPDIARAVDLVAEAFRAGGRLFYVGAGTSGRLGVLDAAECPPTFRTKPSTVQGIIAGGKRAVFRAIEGAEDGDGSAEISSHGVIDKDVVFGIAACGQTRFVRTALGAAREKGCRTVFLSSNPPQKNDPAVDVRIAVVVGPEAIAGSTRMKAATAAKMVLNMVTTAAMIKIGKTYGNLMVDLNPKSEKLRRRATRIVAHLSGIRRRDAETYLKKAKGSVKVATVMARRSVGYGKALQLLNENRNFLRGALGEEQDLPSRKRRARKVGKTGS
ncbi:N-acetylmuramic acid 6-phosphate etherase [bacterium]|nr:N-acetylmuramic acid 6-phosphate etherase [bacterium]